MISRILGFSDSHFLVYKKIFLREKKKYFYIKKVLYDEIVCRRNATTSSQDVQKCSTWDRIEIYKVGKDGVRDEMITKKSCGPVECPDKRNFTVGMAMARATAIAMATGVSKNKDAE